MCGRYSFAPDLKIVNQHYGITIDDGEIEPNYNCAPSQKLPITSNDSPQAMSFYTWGLIPFWAKDKSIGYKMINARGETLAEKPAFRNAWKTRRCLVPADAFYEWKKTQNPKEKKIPYRIFLPEQSIFSMAGIWEQWKNPDGEIVRSFSIVTTQPNSLMAEIHDRMPVILSKENEKKWLMLNDEKSLRDLIKPFPVEKMDAYQISTLVNTPKNNSKQIIEKIII